jgi:DNA-binding CsgD family transcriptional regulator
VLSATSQAFQRTRFLPAHVEIMLAAGAVDEARAAADELTEMAATWGMEVLTAIAQHAEGAVLLAEGKAAEAIDPLRRSQEVWQRVGAPYLGARVRRVLGLAFHAVGDEDGALLELDAARKVFEALGAAPDLGALEAVSVSREARAVGKDVPHDLSSRELEVLLLLASGKTNKVIARELFVSERTVDRHVSNIFAKVGVASRAAATAWAYEHGLIG